jgi:hypothetical protein
MDVEDMTEEQVKLAREAGKLAHDHLSGAKLYEGLKIAESLLVGRNWAMMKAGVNNPRGRAYAEQFSHWKLPDRQGGGSLLRPSNRVRR